MVVFTFGFSGVCTGWAHTDEGAGEGVNCLYEGTENSKGLQNMKV